MSIFACEYCGGALEPAVIAAGAAAWGYGCYLITRVLRLIRRKRTGPSEN